jgi:hypothetical protein
MIHVFFRVDYRAVNHIAAIAGWDSRAVLRGSPKRMMGHDRRLAALAIVLGTLLCAPSGGDAAPTNAMVLGDSQGAGVQLASGLKGFAHNSVHIRGAKAIEQINATPNGATAFLVLGSNDAEFNIKGLDKSIDDIVHAAEARNIALVWIGPPCVRKAWNERSRELDQMLAQRFAQGPVKYVSMWDDTICSFVFHEPDGVHLTMKGYEYIWKKASAVAGFTLASAESAPIAAVSVPAPAEKAVQRSARIHKPHRRHARHVVATVSTRQAQPFWFDRQDGGN